MPVIKSYSFGRMAIDDMTYTKDIIIFPDGSILSPWWRGEGHRLQLSDISPLIDMAPDIIVAGTGASGLMKPTEEVRSILRAKNIEFIARPTGEAVQIYNDQSLKRTAGGCFHLTC